MHLPRSLRTYAREARSAFVHAPLEVVLGVVLAAAFSCSVRQNDGELFFRVAVAAGLSMPLLLGLSVLRARGVVAAGARWIASGVVLAIACGYAALLFAPDLSAERWRWLALFAAAALSLPLTAVAGGGARERVRGRVWAFSIELLLRVVGVGAYGALLYAALAGAVAAVSNLFELRTPDHLYADLAGIVFFALVPWVIVGGVPGLARAGAATEPTGARAGENTVAEVANDPGPPRVASLLGRFLYAPVLGIYLLILYAYTLKVLATGELPKNLLSPIILFAGLGGLLGGVLLEPLHRSAEARGIARLVRAFPLLLLPLLPLAVWAVGLRLVQYGWTEFRYLRLALLLALVLLAVGGTLRLLSRRVPLLVAIPAVLAAVLFLSSVGPWSAQAVSRRDQQARLRGALADAGMLQGDSGMARMPDTTAPVRRLSPDRFDRIAGGATYLYGAHGARALRGLVPEPERYEDGWSLLRALRVEPGCEPMEVRYAGAALPVAIGVPDLPAGTLYRLSAHERAVPPAGGPVRLSLRGPALLVAGGSGTERWNAAVDLSATIGALAAGADGCGAPSRVEPPALSLEEAVRPLVDGAGRARGTLVITSLGIRWDPASSALAVQHAEALAVVR